jgi:DNA-binding CsgD family transcriptional regulator
MRTSMSSHDGIHFRPGESIVGKNGGHITRRGKAVLYGRETERSVIDALIASARGGRSGVLVVVGEEGAGKSALLDTACAPAAMTVLYACGVESEARLPYAGLHQLLRPVLSMIDRLCEPQARALRGALGLEQGRNDEWFLVSLAVLSLLAEAAEEQPVLCVVDDAHWLDDASAESLLFAARRLEAESVAMLFAAREGESPSFRPRGLPELRLGALPRDAARVLLDRHVGSTLSVEARERLIDGTGGNPLALVELSATLDESQLAGLAPLPVSRNVVRAFRSRIARLPQPTRSILLVAAADDTGSVATVLQAAARLGAVPDALDAAEHADLVRVHNLRIEFRHPLIRSAVYQAAPFSHRRAAHAALADVLDVEAEADRWAWHRAAASVEPDVSAAADLERAAARAYRRSGFVAASLAYERAAQLCPDGAQRIRLQSGAVDAAWLAGRLPRALDLLEQARPLATGPAERAEISRWRGLIEMSIGIPTDARDLLVRAATELPTSDTARGLHSLGLACLASAYAGEGEHVPAIAAIGERFSASASALTGFLGCFVSGLGAYFAGDHCQAAKRFRRVLALADEADTAGSAQVPGLLILAGAAALLLGDDGVAERMNRRLMTRAREMGALPLVNEVLPRLGLSRVGLGRWSSASADLIEGHRLAGEIGQHQVLAHMLSVSALIAGLLGSERECRMLAGQAQELAAARRLVHVEQTARWALLVLELGLGHPEEAFQHAREIPHLPFAHWSAPDRVEAALRAGHDETARSWLDRFTPWAEHTGAQWAAAAALRCRALLTENEAQKETVFAEALELSEHCLRPFEYGRTALLYGEWLRRIRRRTDARAQLRIAVDVFERLGASLWAERGRGELRAAGETASAATTPDLLNQLTPQELQVVRLAAAGLSNRAIGAQLFLSPRTVGYHLYKAYPKLGVTSRRELARLRLDAS